MATLLSHKEISFQTPQTNDPIHENTSNTSNHVTDYTETTGTPTGQRTQAGESMDSMNRSSNNNNNNNSDDDDDVTMTEEYPEPDQSTELIYAELRQLDTNIIARIASETVEPYQKRRKLDRETESVREHTQSLTQTDQRMMSAVLTFCLCNAHRQIKENESNNNAASGGKKPPKCKPPKSLCPFLCSHPSPDTVNHCDFLNRCFGLCDKPSYKSSMYSAFSNDDLDDTKILQIGKAPAEIVLSDVPAQEKKPRKNCRKSRRISKPMKMEVDDPEDEPEDEFDNIPVDFETLTNDMRIGYLFRFGCKVENNNCPPRNACNEPIYRRPPPTCQSSRREGVFKDNCAQTQLDENSVCCECGAFKDLTITNGRVECNISVGEGGGGGGSTAYPGVNIQIKRYQGRGRVSGDESSSCDGQPTNRKPLRVIPSTDKKPTAMSCEKDDNELNDQGLLNKYGVLSEESSDGACPDNQCHSKVMVNHRKRHMRNACRKVCTATEDKCRKRNKTRNRASKITTEGGENGCDSNNNKSGRGSKRRKSGGVKKTRFPATTADVAADMAEDCSDATYCFGNPKSGDSDACTIM